MSNLKYVTMNHSAINSWHCIRCLKRFIFGFFLGILTVPCSAQNQGPDESMYFTLYGEDTVGLDYVTFTLPQYELTNDRIGDSIRSAISKLKREWNYDSITKGYTFSIHFYDKEDELAIHIYGEPNSKLYSELCDTSFDRITFKRTFKGCMYFEGYLVTIMLFYRVSESEVSDYFEYLDRQVTIKAFDPIIKPFSIGDPFTHMSFRMPISVKKHYIETQTNGVYDTRDEGTSP